MSAADVARENRELHRLRAQVAAVRQVAEKGLDAALDERDNSAEGSWVHALGRARLRAYSSILAALGGAS